MNLSVERAIELVDDPDASGELQIVLSLEDLRGLVNVSRAVYARLVALRNAADQSAQACKSVVTFADALIESTKAQPGSGGK